MIVILKNHICKFNKRLLKQKHGGAIGVSLAGDIANLFMVWWDRELKRRLAQNNMFLKLYARYVDDGNIAIKKIVADSDSMEVNKEKLTMEKVKQIANEIHESIKVKVDFPSNYEIKRLPVLDMEFWIEEIEINGEKKNQILYSHYMKPVSSRYVVHKKSAMSYNAKINILTNELIRIMRNISCHVTLEEKQSHIQYFMYRLQFSGYSKADKIKIYKKSQSKFTERLNKDKEGLIPLHRSKFWNLNERKQHNNKQTWYTKGGYKSTFFVEATPNEELKRKCESIIKNCGLKIKVLEKTGKSVKQHLVKSDPFKESKCADSRCPICASDKGLNCKMKDTVYKHECADFENCKGVYIGETSDSIKERTLEHMQKCHQKCKESAHYKHNLDKHKGEQKPLSISILGRCPNDPMLRQCMEAVMIKDLNPNMNSREEWGNKK